MMMAAGGQPDDRWDRLQEPAHPGQLAPQFRMLLSALDLGWHVEEPVYLRPRWSDEGPRVYLFILRRSQASPPKLVSVPEGQAISHFVRQEGWQVIAPANGRGR